MSSLLENLNSEFLNAYSNLLPPTTSQIVLVYVESEEDIAFWRHILHPYETQQRKFEIRLPSNESLGKGKRKALERSKEILNLVSGELGTNLLVCVDSDYDYLLQNHYSTIEKQAFAARTNHNKYVLQTYTYSAENLKCYAPSLHTVCVAATLNDERKVNFKAFMKHFSNIVYDLFLWNLLFYSKGEDDKFTLSNFCSLIKIPNALSFETGETIENILNNILSNIHNKVSEKITILKQTYSSYEIEVSNLGEQLKSSYLTKDNTYLFIQGHTIFDCIVLQVLKPLTNLLRKQHRNTIKSLSHTPTEQKNALQHYHNKTKDLKIASILTNNTKFSDCFLFQKIKHDIDSCFPTTIS